MTVQIRPATPDDIGTLVPVLLQDASARHDRDPSFWALAPDAGDRIKDALSHALTAPNPPFRQMWLIAEAAGKAVGVAHSILLPVPPIYAGEDGAPGLIMEDCHVTPDAPDDTASALLAAAEADLRDAGARVLLASAAACSTLATQYAVRDYAPLTLYLAKNGLSAQAASDDIRPATPEALKAIVALSARHRDILNRINRFWKPHPDANARFEGWMGKSLTLPDRDMTVCADAGATTGYIVSQPATPLHFPPAHDISRTGVIDDFHHVALDRTDRATGDTASATALLHAAETALHARGNRAAMVVCPADWPSKVALLQDAGFETAITWHIKQEPARA